MVNARKVSASPGSKRGLHYVSATDHRIPNVGEVDLDIATTEVHHDAIVLQIAEVNKALLSISDRVDNRCRVIFDQDDETGEVLAHIYNKRTDTKMELRRVGKVWILDGPVTEDFLTDSILVSKQRGT